jgi:hypothetical protein
MADEKSITEKLTDAISRATDSVKSTMGNIVDTASNAAQYAMESNAEKISGQTAAELDPGRIAATANEQVYIPEAAGALAMPVPLVAVQPAPKKRTSRWKSVSGKTPPAKTPVTKKSNGKAAGKTAKKAAKKSAPGKSKKSTRKKSAKKTTKRTTKKSAKKVWNEIGKTKKSKH